MDSDCFNSPDNCPSFYKAEIYFKTTLIKRNDPEEPENII